MADVPDVPSVMASAMGDAGMLLSHNVANLRADGSACLPKRVSRPVRSFPTSAGVRRLWYAVVARVGWGHANAPVISKLRAAASFAGSVPTGRERSSDCAMESD